MPSEPVLVVLPERAGLPEVGPLAADLARALAASAPVVIETATATEVTLPMVQLLLAAHRQAAAQGTTVDVELVEGSALAVCLDAHGLGPAALRIEGDRWTGLAEAAA